MKAKVSNYEQCDRAVWIEFEPGDVDPIRENDTMMCPRCKREVPHFYVIVARGDGTLDEHWITHPHDGCPGGNG